MSTPDTIIEQLQDTLEQDQRLTALLERSVVKARDLAEAELNPDLFAALEWPQNLDQYEAYLTRFIRWVPRQSDAKAWKNQAPEDRYAKEVSDRLSHFFWLIDQKVDEGETAIAENSDIFRDWLTEFARQWGSFLDTTESFSQDILDSFIQDAPEYAVGDSMVDGVPNMPSGWLTFNQFFARELNAGLRPVAEPASNLVITSPADCSFQHQYDIDSESNIPATTIKNTHKYGNIRQLIEGSEYAETFAAGLSSTTCCLPRPTTASTCRFRVWSRSPSCSTGRSSCRSTSRTTSCSPATAPQPAMSFSRPEGCSPSTRRAPTAGTSASSR